MTISDLVDQGLDALTSDHVGPEALAIVGALALGAAAVGAIMSDREEKAIKALEAAGLQVMGLRVLESGELQVVVDARDLARSPEGDAQAREREKRAYQVLMLAGLAPQEAPADAATAPFVTALRRKHTTKAGLFERLPPILNFFL